jgi:hypothetical protein
METNCVYKVDELLKSVGFYRDSESVRYESTLMYDVPFIWQHVFSKQKNSDEQSSFKGQLDYFKSTFVRRLLEHRQQSGKSIDVIEFINKAMTDLPNATKLYEQLMQGCEIVIPFPVCKAKIHGMRCGTSIAIAIKSTNSGGEDHEEGSVVLTIMSQSPERLTQPFFHKHTITIKLHTEFADHNIIRNASLIDFCLFFANVERHCPDIEWLFSDTETVQKILDEYLSAEAKPVLVAKYYGDIEIGARLIHSKEHHQKQSRQWKRGNVVANHGQVVFEKGDDLCIALDVLSGLPEGLLLSRSEIDPKTDILMTQGRMRYAAATIFAQLKAAFLNKEVQRIVGFE